MKRAIFCAAVVVAAVGLSGFGELETASAAGPGARNTRSKYIGVAKCKNCHRSEKSGNQFAVWKQMKHAKAFEVLASTEARKAAKDLGISDPQKSEKCLKCHVTAYGAPKRQRGRGLKHEQGVQCESCHGPGGKHLKARFAAAAEEEDDGEKEYEPLPEGEIVTRPGQEVCRKCHNEEAPTFKGFCFKKRFKEIAHNDPRKERGPEALAHLKCDCRECGGTEQPEK